MEKHLRLLFEKIESTPLTLGTWAITLFALIAIRIAIESFFDNISFHFADQYFYKFGHFFFTFTFTYLIALPIVTWFARVTIKQAAAILLFGFLVIWTPPIIDEIISRGVGFWSFYTFDSLTGLWGRYLTFFGDRPDIGITYGVRAEIALVLVGMMTYTWIKTRSFIRSIGGTLLLYTALFLIGALPSLVTFAFLGSEKSLLSISELDIASFMMSPTPLYVISPPDVSTVLAVKMSLVYAVLLPLLILFTLFFFFRSILLALWHNLRLPQIVYHAGLFLIGVALVFVYEGKIAFSFDWLHFAGLFSMLLAVILSWTASVIVNDLHDVAIDKLTNPKRPLIERTIPVETYRIIGVLMFFFAVFLAGLVSTQLAILLAMYQALAWIYSAWPLRLKRFPFIATILASSASLFIFFGGYIVFSVEKNIDALPWPVITLLFIAYTFLLPIKDFKDIPGDKADGVITLPVLFGEVWAKRLIGSILFFVFLASIFVFKVLNLFFLAFFFGSIAYWLLQISSKDHRYFNYHHLAHWYVTLVSAYVFFLALQFISR